MINLKKQTPEWHILFNQSEAQTGWDVTNNNKTKQTNDNKKEMKKVG